jgi:hypothetical protein
MRKLDIFVLVGMFFLPAAVALFFAWSVWFANKRPIIAGWRLATFRWGLIAAVMATIAFSPGCVQELRTLEPAHGVLLIANWAGIVLWIIGLAGASTGKGWGRITLICWGILMFFGLFGVSSAMIP